MVQQSLNLSQDLSLRQEQIIAPHQIQSLEILAIPLMDLQARVNQELQENPTLEQLDSETERLVGDPVSEASAPDAPEDLAGHVAENDQYLANLMQLDEMWRDYVPPSHTRQFSSEDDEEKRRYFFDSLTADKTLADDLLEQLSTSDADAALRRLAEVIIGSLDATGYLRMSVDELARTAGAHHDDMLRALALVQSFEPAGIAARDLRECLQLQLQRLGRQDSLAYRVVDKHLEDLARNHIPQVARALGVTPAALYEAMTEIKQLQPRPGNAVESNDTQYILPELTVEKNEDGEYVVRTHRDYLPRLRISAQYLRILEDPQVPREVKQYVKDKITGGNLLIKSIAQRQTTLQRIAEVIVQRQYGYFDQGEEALVPLTMNQVAEEIGVHETTVSRAIASKYVQTPRGLLPLKFFFTGGYATADGEQLSSHSIKHKIQSLISEEDPARPISDQQIMDQLKAQGLTVARRTVAKYREELGIPSSHLRKSFTA
jgi:RNA polymerase sigma-54 factor